MKLPIPEHWPRDGEIPMKQWREQMAERLGTSPGAIANLLMRGRLKYPPVRRVNERVVFVIIDPQAAAKPQFIDDTPGAESYGHRCLEWHSPKKGLFCLKRKTKPTRLDLGHKTRLEIAWRKFRDSLDLAQTVDIFDVCCLNHNGIRD